MRVMSATIIVGGQWGDEAKGKISSYLTIKDNIAIACRAGLGVEVLLDEGTNGFLLSVFYGTYPYTVGKDSTASSVAADVGLEPRRIDEVILV